MAVERPWQAFSQVFDGVACAYDRVRPGYPVELVDAALRRGGLSAGSRVLEVGCGTGKLTRLLVEAGLSADAVDPGQNMIEVARRHVAGAEPGVRFHVGRFEDVELGGEAFAAVMSATAFHWVDPAVGWAKAAAHLRPGGLLALFQYVGLRDERSEEIDRAFLEVLREHAPAIAAEWHEGRDLDTLLHGVRARRDNVAEVWDWIGYGRHKLATADAARLFTPVEIDYVLTRWEQTADDAIALFRTSVVYHRIDPDKRAAIEEADRAIIEAAGGTTSEPVANLLVSAFRA